MELDYKHFQRRVYGEQVRADTPDAIVRTRRCILARINMRDGQKQKMKKTILPLGER